MPIAYIGKILANSLWQSLPYICLFIVIRLLFYRRRQSWRAFWLKEQWIWLFFSYLIVLIQITVFRFGLNWVPFDVPREVNLIPFDALRFLAPWALFYNVVGNIVWFMPFGLLLPKVTHFQRFYQVTFLGALLSISIESLQFIFYTGITDTDDIIFNTLGASLGWLLLTAWRYLKKIIHWLKSKK